MKHGDCFMCGIPLYTETAMTDQSDAYEIDGHILCDDCVDKYVKDNFKKKLVFENVPDDYGNHEDCYPNKEEQ